MSDSGFYRAFEDRHRGSRSLIKTRLAAYVPFLQTILAVYPNAETLDLGCGRGEWLELLVEQGFSARGVDLDKGMLAACHERGLSATLQDAIEALNACPDESIAVLSAFHVVEHIPFETLLTLVKEAFRVLKPAGLLILETPNPENLTVGTANFYTDPTHERPVPSPLLSFLPEYAGFYRTKVLRLQESETLRTKGDINLMDVLAGVSPDYAVVAQKPGRRTDLIQFDEEFEREFGLNLSNLATRFDSSLARRFAQLDLLADKASAAEHQLAEVNTRVGATEAQAAVAVQSATEAQTAAREANDQAHRAWAELYQVYASRSWSVTRPLRWLMLQLRRLRTEGLISRVKALIKKVLRGAFALISRFPKIKRILVRLSLRLGVYGFLRAKQFRIFPPKQEHADDVAPSPELSPSGVCGQENALSPNAKRMYKQLKEAQGRAKGGQ